MKNYPNPNTIYPIENVDRVVFLKNIMSNSQVEIGDYTYYDDPEDVYNFEKNINYLFDFIGDKLIIGKFCQIATGVRFIMNGGRHRLHSFSTYPFEVFCKAWERNTSDIKIKGNTIIGNDVWIGNSATFMPGIKIGDGAIIGTNSLVTKNVEPYTVVGGNPTREIRKRFDQSVIDILLKLQWWNWNIEKITEHLDIITSNNVEKLKEIYNEDEAKK